MLIEWLRQRDATCPLCGYNLRALPTPRCPECGQSLRLSVALAEPYLKAWITLLVFSCFGAGLGILFLIDLIKNGYAYESAVERIASAVFIFSTPWPLIVVRTRRKFLKLSRGAQWLWTIPPSALILLAFILVLISIIIG